MRKLGQKLAICIGASVAFAGIVTAVLAIRSKQRILDVELRYASGKLVAGLSAFCAEALLQGDYARLERHARRASRDNPDIAYVRVWRALREGEYEVVARYAPPEPRSVPEMGYLVFRKVISERARDDTPTVLGQLEIGVSSARITRLVNFSTWQLIPGYIITFAVLTFVVNLMLKRSVLDPIRVLDEHAERISCGQLDVAIEVQSDDELGGLAKTMETMRLALRESYARTERQVQELEESKERFRGLLESAPDAMIIADRDGKIVLVNSETERLFDCSRGDLMGRAVDKLLPEPFGDGCDESGRAPVEGLPVRAMDGSLELYALRKEDDKFPVAVSVSPLKIEKETFAAIAIRDVTERRRMEHDLQRSRTEAQAASHAKSEFLANMSHELRTPLHGILSFANFGVRRHATSSREQLLKYFLKIKESGKTLLNLLNLLLDLAKVESGKMDFDFQPTDFAALVRAVVDEFSSLVSEQNITVHLSEDGAKADVRVDKEKMKQVVRNLMSNALRFSPEDGAIRVDLRRGKDSVVLSVSDEGPGIPEDELDAVFDKFVQSSKTKTGAGGTGLGLAISREIVGWHGGRIWAGNNPDGGARFTFEIPLGPAAHPEPRQASGGARPVGLAAAPAPGGQRCEAERLRISGAKRNRYRV